MSIKRLCGEQRETRQGGECYLVNDKEARVGYVLTENNKHVYVEAAFDGDQTNDEHGSTYAYASFQGPKAVARAWQWLDDTLGRWGFVRHVADYGPWTKTITGWERAALSSDHGNAVLHEGSEHIQADAWSRKHNVMLAQARMAPTPQGRGLSREDTVNEVKRVIDGMLRAHGLQLG